MAQPEQAPTFDSLKQDIQGALTATPKTITPFTGNFVTEKPESKFGMQSPEKTRQVQRDADIAVMEQDKINAEVWKNLNSEISYDAQKKREEEDKIMAASNSIGYADLLKQRKIEGEETMKRAVEIRLDEDARTFAELPIEKEIDKLLINGPVTQPYPPQRPDEDFATWKEGYLQNEKSQKDAFVDAATKDYFQYLKWIKPEFYDYEKNKYDSIIAKPKEEWDAKDEKYIRDFRADAIAINARATNVKLKDLEETYDFDDYNRRMVELGPEIDQLNKDIQTTSPDDPNYPTLVEKSQQLQSFIDDIVESTGVTNDAVLEYGKLAGQAKSLNRTYVYEKHKGDYSKVLDDEFSKEIVRKEEYEKALKGEYGFGKFMHEAVGAFAQSMVSIPQNLKVWGDASGDTDYDPIDRMYDSLQYEKDIRTGSTFGDPTNEKDTYENLPFTSQIALTGGNAIGSMATFMLGGVASGGLAKSFGASLTGVQIAQRAGTFTTAFLTTEPSYFQEALDAGMTSEEAAKSAAILAALTAGAEMIVNDASYVNGSSLVSSMGKLLKSTYTKGMSSKEATKLVGKAILQTVKSANKEGLEEVFQGDVESVTKEQINLQNSIEYFNTTYDAQARSRDYLGGFVAGGGMKAVMSSNSQHPDTEKVMLELARAQSLEVAAMYDPTILEMATPIIEQLQENLQGLESHSNWNTLSYEEQAHALALTNQINNIEAEKKKIEGVRLADKAKEEQIAAIENELNEMFNAPKQETKPADSLQPKPESAPKQEVDERPLPIPLTLPPPAEVKVEAVSKKGEKGTAKVYRVEGMPKDDKNDVTFYSTDESYVQEFYTGAMGNENDIVESDVSYENAVRVKLPNDQFSDPKFEAPHIETAIKNGNDAIIFENEDNGDTFIAIVNKEQPKTTTETEAPVANQTEETVTSESLPPTVVEQGEDTEVTPQPEVKKGKNAAKAQAARERAEAIRKATDGTAMIAPKLYAAALDVYADLLDTFDTVAEAIKEFRKTKEYQALEQGDKDEIENEIAEAPTPTETQDFENNEGETKERGFVKQVRASKDISNETKAAFKDDRINYKELPNKVSIREANALIDAMGMEEAARLATSTSGDIPGAFRVAMAEILIKKYNEQGNYQAAVDIVQDIAEIGTNYGQAIQAFSLFKYLTPEGQVLMAQREVDRQRSERLNKPVHKKKTRDIKKAIDKANKEAVEETIKRTSGRIDETTVSMPPPPKREKSYGAKNKIVTKDKYEKARAALKTKMFATVVPPPELIEVGIYHIEAGAREFADFAKRMVEDFGAKVKDYLEATYDAATIELEARAKEEDIAQGLKDFGNLLSQRIPSPKAKVSRDEKLTELAKRLDELSGTTEYSKLKAEYDALKQSEKDQRKAEIQAREDQRKADRKAISDAKKAAADQAREDKKQADREKRATTERAITQGLKDLNLKIQDIIRDHYTVQDQVGRTLGQKLAQEAGLTGQEADRLAGIVEREFNRIATEKKQKAIQNLFSRKNRNKPEIKTLEKKLIELSNLGALDAATINDVYADALGFPKLTPENVQRIKTLAERVRDAKTEREQTRATEDLLKYQENIKGFSLMDASQAFWMSMILSGPKTQAINIVANAYNMASLYSDAVLQNPKSARFIGKGLAVGLKKGFFEGIDTLKTGYAPIRGKVEIPSILERTRFKGGDFNPANYAKYVRRFMMAADTFSFEGLRQMRSFQMALKMAEAENKIDPSVNVRQRALDILNRGNGILEAAIDQAMLELEEQVQNIETSSMTAKEKKDAIKNAKFAERFRIYELVEKNRPEEITTEAHDYAARGTYNNKPEGVLGVLSDAMNALTRKLPIVRFVVPFVNVISNVANTLIDNSPVGAIGAYRGTGTIFNANKREMTEQQKVDAYAKAIKGTVIMALTYALTFAGDDDDEPLLEITANGYGDFKKNADLQAQGWKPYSYRVNGGPWISYKETPFALGLAYIGNQKDFEKYRKEKINDAWYTKQGVAATGTVRMFFDATFLSSGESFLGSLLDSRNESVGDDMSQWVNKTASSFVIPNLVTQTDQLVGDWMNTPEKEIRDTYMGRVFKSIPVARDQYFNKVNGLGEDITQQLDIIYSINESGKSDKLWNLLVEKKSTTGTPNKKSVTIIDEATEKERVLTDEEFYKFSKIRGSFVKTMLEENYDDVKEKDEKEFEKWFSDVKSRGTTIAKVFLNEKFPKDVNYYEYLRDNYSSDEIKTYMVIPNKKADDIRGIEKEIEEDAK